MGADGALTTAVDALYLPSPSTGRARLAVSAVVLLAALSACDIPVTFAKSSAFKSQMKRHSDARNAQSMP
ncbi:hypothetical protein DXO181_14135 [Xanthomonas oryzae pv. oryzae]|nr:hypothetical protein BXO559_06155 [Xanthomonas oryzae pv. oryzae]OLH67626.1 hypothetical protein DXO181_14135 [Xanthomonas oryzae pv. oryzae]OLH68398.1 hypothetical protein DXO200_10665 [Xanthomonas oryzae pv. oryzae]OLH98783.1 hypothetical protein DXO331_03570 [Xanthomonas oryzae pv. oryzae]PNR90434.1 hypothetical protein LA05_02295 [Xanthomonas oryzae pv. oryzae]